MLLGILAAVAAVIALFVIVVATRPGAFRIERSIAIAAPPESAFALVNDFHAWAGWSPWEKLDPQMTKTFEGPSSGLGARYGWSSNGKAGEGKMTIEKSEAAKLITIKLEFMKPFQATNVAIFSFTKTAEGTRVTWAMEGVRTFGFKAAALLMDMDKLIGRDFEKGLADIKANAEQPSSIRASA